MSRLKSVLFGLAIALTLSVGNVAMATTPTLPATGVDLEGLMGLGITAMGAVAVVAVGGYIAFLLVKKGLRWTSRALG